ncbi:hypothetical protein NL676_014238 [Syzygium grande]|nr:hypothetical protein NL676_014238 [Syzygium grande]
MTPHVFKTGAVNCSPLPTGLRSGAASRAVPAVRPRGWGDLVRTAWRRRQGLPLILTVKRRGRFGRDVDRSFSLGRGGGARVGSSRRRARL